MKLHRRYQHVWITSEHWLPWVDKDGRIQYYKLWEEQDFYLFQNSTGTCLIHLDADKLERVKQELEIEGEIIVIHWRERQYWSHSWYALVLSNDWKNWLHTSRRKKLQWILTKVQDSVVWNLWITTTWLSVNSFSRKPISPTPTSPQQ